MTHNHQRQKVHNKHYQTKQPCSPCPKKPASSVKLLDLVNFKTQPCKLQMTHNPKKCFYYHDANKMMDRRRPLGTYISEICSAVQQDSAADCQYGDACVFAHNKVEDFYHPEKYKTKFCRTYPDKVDQCDYGEMCAYAHSEEELSVDQLDKFERDDDFYMFHFKTVWCPLADTKHARDVCVYAHNWQDFRRKPHLYEYHSEQCSTWDSKRTTKTYLDGCKLEYRCNYCHGWKEQEYHPDNYKMNECRPSVQSKTKCKKAHCPYYHSEEERRTQVPKTMKLFPRNRGTTASQTQVYQHHYLNVMFNDQTSVLRPNLLHHGDQTNLGIIQQQVYGCGPQSVPVIDPMVILSYQYSVLQLSHAHLFKETLTESLLNSSLVPIQKDSNHYSPPSPQKDQLLSYQQQRMLLQQLAKSTNNLHQLQAHPINQNPNQLLIQQQLSQKQANVQGLNHCKPQGYDGLNYSQSMSHMIQNKKPSPIQQQSGMFDNAAVIEQQNFRDDDVSSNQFNLLNSNPSGLPRYESYYNHPHMTQQHRMTQAHSLNNLTHQQQLSQKNHINSLYTQKSQVIYEVPNTHSGDLPQNTLFGSNHNLTENLINRQPPQAYRQMPMQHQAHRPPVDNTWNTGMQSQCQPQQHQVPFHQKSASMNTPTPFVGNNIQVSPTKCQPKFNKNQAFEDDRLDGLDVFSSSMVDLDDFQNDDEDAEFIRQTAQKQLNITSGNGNHGQQQPVTIKNSRQASPNDHQNQPEIVQFLLNNNLNDLIPVLEQLSQTGILKNKSVDDLAGFDSDKIRKFLTDTVKRGTNQQTSDDVNFHDSKIQANYSTSIEMFIQALDQRSQQSALTSASISN